MPKQLAQTPLHSWHASHGGRMVDFAGWSMPVQYTSIVAEHHATRNGIGLFDVSHMGRLYFSGKDVARFLDWVVTRRVDDMPQGRVRYGLITSGEGGILDDVLVYRLADDAVPYGMVVNAGNREKILGWLQEQRAAQPDWDVNWQDRTAQTCMIAVQGPRAVEVADALLDIDLSRMKYYRGQMATILGNTTCQVSRTGYTGEDGCEIIAGAEHAVPIWEAILAAGAPHDARAAGLGCRDTLRLEAAMPLYGHELTGEINPVQAGLSFAYNLAGREFIGREAIAAAEADPPSQVRCGLVLSGKRVPREHYSIFSGDREVGEVTSGTFSPTLNRPIAMAYVERTCTAPGTELNIDIRGRRETAEVVKLPFYRRGAPQTDQPTSN